MIIDGKQIAEDVLNKLKFLPNPGKFLAIVYVGENPASQSFINKKKDIADRLGVEVKIHRFKEDIKEETLLEEVNTISENFLCGGIIIQLPLPSHIKPDHVLNIIPFEKDVDVLGQVARHKFMTGGDILPPSASALEEIIRKVGLDLSRTRAVILGVGPLIGQPISTWLKGKVKELTLLDKGDDASGLKDADLIVLGTGQPGIVSSSELKEDCVVIDFGTKFEGGKLRGDFKSDPEAKIIFTPTPGGTGPILVAKIFENFYKLNKQ